MSLFGGAGSMVNDAVVVHVPGIKSATTFSLTFNAGRMKMSHSRVSGT